MIKVENASFGYSKDILLYKNVHFKVHSGEILSILGPNGCGKTTLLKCVMNFLHFHTGKICIKGKSVNEYSTQGLWKIISYVPQAKGVSTQLNVLEMVALGRIPYLQGFKQPQQSDYQAAEDIIASLNIQYLTHKRCDEISGGEYQMVLLARALVSEPKVLILDEPESNLDFKNQMMILKQIKTLANGANLTCIINTHYPDHALKISDKTLLINKWQKNTLFGATADICTENNLKEIFNIDVIVDQIHRNNQTHNIVIPVLDS